MGGTGIAGAGTNYTGASDPTSTTPAGAINGDSYFQTSSQLMWIKVAGTWQKVIPQITSGNATQFLASAAIGQAQIGSAAIGVAQIINASVETLKIAGNAVTVPSGLYQAASVYVTAGAAGLVKTNYRSFHTLTIPVISTTESASCMVLFGTDWNIGTSSNSTGVSLEILLGVTVSGVNTQVYQSYVATVEPYTSKYGNFSSGVTITIAANTSVTLKMYCYSLSYEAYDRSFSNRYIYATTIKR